MMNVNRRTALLVVVVVIVIGGVYAITRWQQARETTNLLFLLHSEDHGEAMKAMTGLRERAGAIEDQLVQNLKTGREAVRWRSAVLLGSVNSSKAKQALEGALTDDDDDVRMDAALALGKLGHRGAADRLALMAASTKEEIPVRTAAVRALLLLKSGSHLPEVAQIASQRPPLPPTDEEIEAGAEVPPDDTAQLRATAVEALGVLGGVADQEVASRVRDSKGNVGATAAESALNVLKESANPELEPNPVVRQAACLAVADLVRDATEERVCSDAVRVLVQAYKDEHADVKTAAIHALSLVSIPDGVQTEAARVITQAKSDDDYWVREAAIDAASSLGLGA